MMKIKGDPGKFIPFDEVRQILTAPAYGAADLVELGLFFSEGYVRSAMSAGKLKFQKINKRSVIMCRDDILEYWSKYRSKPFEKANNLLSLRVTISEADYVAKLIEAGQNRINREFNKDDLFRNIILHMQKNKTSVETAPQLFIKR